MQLIKFIIKHYNGQKEKFAGMSAVIDTDLDGQVLPRALLKGVINHPPACRHACVAAVGYQEQHTA